MNYSVPEKIKYVAEVEDVREVTLIANADLSYWRDHLRNSGFVPYVDNGKAELMISSADLKWKSMRSQEVSVSVKICCTKKMNPTGTFSFTLSIRRACLLSLNESFFILRIIMGVSPFQPNIRFRLL